MNSPASTLSTLMRPPRVSHGAVRRLLAWLRAFRVSASERQGNQAALEALSLLDEHALHDVAVAGCLMEQAEARRASRERCIEELLHSGEVLPR